MLRSLRNSCTLAAALLCLLQSASADLKIKTRTTVMGHSTESTVYIKGARERREMSFGGRFNSVNITQCDQKRMVSISGNNCIATQMGTGAASCPVLPAMPKMGSEMPDAAESAPPRKGGVMTITRTSTDTGERQDLFGYKARHIKTSMSTESSPDACNQSHTKIETDGWYADLSVAFSCADESVHALACGGMGGRGRAPQCQDRIVMKGSGGGALGYPLKQTTTIASDRGTFTTTTEVVELTSVTLDPALFEMPESCRVSDISSLMSGTSSAPQPEAPSAPTATPPKTEAAPAAAPAAATASPVAAKASGVVRIGVVKIKDSSSQDLPTDNLRINLMGEITSRNMEAVAIDTDAPQPDVVSEAREKQCDYILFTTLRQLSDPGGAGLTAALLPKGVALDPAKFQALTDMTLYKTSKPLPEVKDFHVAADADQLGVNAVTATFEKESEKVAQQVAEDAHPKSASKPAAKKPAAHSKPR